MPFPGNDERHNLSLGHMKHMLKHWCGSHVAPWWWCDLCWLGLWCYTCFSVHGLQKSHLWLQASVSSKPHSMPHELCLSEAKPHVFPYHLSYSYCGISLCSATLSTFQRHWYFCFPKIFNSLNKAQLL